MDLPVVRASLRRQYHGALAMLRQAIEECPDQMWDDTEANDVAFWQVAYHTLYFTHLYLHRTIEEFRPWSRHRNTHHDLPWPPDAGARITDPYTRPQILEYWAIVDGYVDGAVERMDLGAPSGIPWHAEMNKFEHQLHNLRHIAHHTGILSGRIRAETGKVIAWVRPRPA